MRTCKQTTADCPGKIYSKETCFHILKTKYNANTSITLIRFYQSKSLIHDPIHSLIAQLHSKYSTEKKAESLLLIILFHENALTQ